MSDYDPSKSHFAISHLNKQSGVSQADKFNDRGECVAHLQTLGVSASLATAFVDAMETNPGQEQKAEIPEWELKGNFIQR